MKGVVDVPVERIGLSTRTAARREIPIESPVAIEVNGIGYAVMMASPVDLADFGFGFALSEKIARSPEDIIDITPHQTDTGWVLKIQIPQAHIPEVAKRIRLRVSDSSCGLCGLDSLDQLARPLPPVSGHIQVDDAALYCALSELRDHQPMNARTGGVHAAAFCRPDGSVVLCREDVGRHNALDKLIGALFRKGVDPRTGFYLLSSRCSYELVEKTVLSGCPLLVTISVATSLAVERAGQAGLRLVALARSDSMLDFSQEVETS